MVTTERLIDTSPALGLINSSTVAPQVNPLWKRVEQLRRWQESETNLASSEPKVKSECKVNFKQPCIFLAACASGDKLEIRSLLNNGVDINTANADGMTALHQACIDGNPEIVTFLKVNGADLNYQDNEGWAPLHAAASCGNMDITRFLVNSGADLTSCNSDRELPVDLADSEDVANFLKSEMDKKGIEDDVCRKSEHNLMLSNAKHLIVHNNKNALMDIHPRTGATALHVAAAKGYDDVLSLLLEAGCDPNFKDFDGWTPLHAAAHWDNTDSVKALMRAGADCDAVNNSGHQVWDVCDEAMFATLINYRSELKNRVAAKPDEAKQHKIINDSFESDRKDVFSSSPVESVVEQDPDDNHDVDTLHKNRSARDVATPAREINVRHKNERIGNLQESLRFLSEKFKSNFDEVNVAPGDSYGLPDSSTPSEASPFTSSESTSTIDESRQSETTNHHSPPHGDFVANRRTRFEAVAALDASSGRTLAPPSIRRVCGGSVRSESAPRNSSNKSWGSCVGSIRFDSTNNQPNLLSSPGVAIIRRSDLLPNATQSENEFQRSKKPDHQAIENSKDASKDQKIKRNPQNVIAGITAVTVSRPPPLTVTANVSVSSNSQSSTPECTSRISSGLRNNRICTPSKDDQAEAERKKRSARARRERRSTQGVSQSDVAQAVAENSNTKNDERNNIRKTPNRWSESLFEKSSQITTSKPPLKQNLEPGISAVAKPVIINKSDGSTLINTKLQDDFSTFNKRKQRSIQRRPTGKIECKDVKQAKSSRDWDTKVPRLIQNDPTLEDVKLEEDCRTSPLLFHCTNVATQTECCFVDKFSKLKCKELSRENEKLLSECEFLKREIYEKNQIICKLKSVACNEQLEKGRIDSFYADIARLKNDNAALIRVITKMSKQS